MTMPFPFVCKSSDSRTGTRPSVRSARKALLAASLLAMPLMLAGCGIFGSDDDEDEIPLYIAKPCPVIGVLKGSERITVFSGQSEDAANVALRAEIGKAAIKCDYDMDDYEITVDLGYTGTAFQGPASGATSVNLQGFMAITRNGVLVEKQLYDIPVEFSGGASQTGFARMIEGTKLPFSQQVNGAAYEILVGFQLSPQQLSYNRRQPNVPMK